MAWCGGACPARPAQTCHQSSRSPRWALCPEERRNHLLAQPTSGTEKGQPHTSVKCRMNSRSNWVKAGMLGGSTPPPSSCPASAPPPAAAAASSGSSAKRLPATSTDTAWMYGRKRHCFLGSPPFLPGGKRRREGNGEAEPRQGPPRPSSARDTSHSHPRRQQASATRPIPPLPCKGTCAAAVAAVHAHDAHDCGHFAGCQPPRQVLTQFDADGRRHAPKAVLLVLGQSLRTGGRRLEAWQGVVD